MSNYLLDFEIYQIQAYLSNVTIPQCDLVCSAECFIDQAANTSISEIFTDCIRPNCNCYLRTLQEPSSLWLVTEMETNLW